MSWPDLAVLGLLLVSAVIGLMRGFAREALGLAAWIGAAYLATRLYGEALPTARRLIADESVADPVAFLVVFTVLLIAFLLLANLLAGLARASPLGGLDRLAGLLFGIARGAAVLVVAYLLAIPLLPVSDWPQPLRESRALPYIRQGAALVAARLPSRFRPDLSRPDLARPGDAVPTPASPASSPGDRAL